MLLKFRFSNFRSFRTEQELSLIASKLPGSGNGLFSPPGLREQVLPVAAIYGANASGKTAVIKAFEFMANAVRFSHSQWQPDQRSDTQEQPLPVSGSAEQSRGSVACPQMVLGIRVIRDWPSCIDWAGL